MILIYKQLFRQIIKDRLFLSLLLLLITLTSLSFFFVIFSIDGNMEMLRTFDTLTSNQVLYQNALHSNTVLAYTFWLSLIGLCVFVFIMFYYRFFRENKKQIGCIKALGFQNRTLQFFFGAFTGILSVFGAIIGLVGGYFLSDILIHANSQTYQMTGLTKGIRGFHFIIGTGVSTLIFCITAILCYGFVRNKETSFLLAGSRIPNHFSVTLKIADCMSKLAPTRQRLSFRIALRKPLSILLLFVAVMSFQVCFILGQSLHISSGKIFRMQTSGHNYEYDTHFLEYQTAPISDDAMVYLDHTAVFIINHNTLERTITGLYETNGLYALRNKDNELLTTPNVGAVYINPEFLEVYGVQVGDSLTAEIAGESYSFTVKEIAVNAKSNHIYMNGAQLAEILDIPSGAYNGILSATIFEGDIVTNKAQCIAELNRNFVSNKTSAIINQVTGVLVGAILIFLALYITFQDNTHDILILNLIGYRIKAIRKLLINVYLPVLWSAFALTLVPSIMVARAIQKSLSISTNDYMPFGVNLLVIVIAFVLITMIYWSIQVAFSFKTKRVIAREKIMDSIYAE